MPQPYDPTPKWEKPKAPMIFVPSWMKRARVEEVRPDGSTIDPNAPDGPVRVLGGHCVSCGNKGKWADHAQPPRAGPAGYWDGIGIVVPSRKAILAQPQKCAKCGDRVILDIEPVE